MANNEKKAWTVITPAGKIYVDTASEANWYKTTYGYIVIRTNMDDED